MGSPAQPPQLSQQGMWSNRATRSHLCYVSTAFIKLFSIYASWYFSLPKPSFIFSSLLREKSTGTTVPACSFCFWVCTCGSAILQIPGQEHQLGPELSTCSRAILSTDIASYAQRGFLIILMMTASLRVTSMGCLSPLWLSINHSWLGKSTKLLQCLEKHSQWGAVKDEDTL